ncbi:MAG: hypothetical protein IT566_10820 [Rhodospirillaceae bacterium]|nr:hypothetical protein [Rhodospirillaceae bacterium]
MSAGAALAAAAVFASAALGADVSLRGAGWSASRVGPESEATATAALWLRERLALTPSLDLGGEAYVVARAPGQRGDHATFELREAYAAYFGEHFDLTVGRQLIVWGRADRIKPTDLASSRDFTSLVTEDDDQKRGVGAVKLGVPVGDVVLMAYAMPEFRAHAVAPLPPLPGLSVRRASPHGAVADHAVRLERTGGRIDWSLTYFGGHDKMPMLSATPVSLAQGVIEERFPKLRMFGGDIAASVGDYGLRAELAHVVFDDLAACAAPVCGGRTSVVVGVDRQFPDDLYVNLQAVLAAGGTERAPPSLLPELFVRNGVLSNRLTASEGGLSWSVIRQWNNQTFRAEFSGVSVFGRSGTLMQARLAYKLTDDIRLTLGGDLYRGKRAGVLGARRDESGVFLEIRHGY